MTRMAAISRKQFLRGWLKPADGSAANGARASDRPAAADDAELAMLQADFPDEMLIEEAARLGLDPCTVDRDTMLRAVLNKMRDQRRS